VNVPPISAASLMRRFFSASFVFDCRTMPPRHSAARQEPGMLKPQNVRYSHNGGRMKSGDRQAIACMASTALG
jgi:hypothetical protein